MLKDTKGFDKEVSAMSEAMIRVRMLGDFCIEYHGNTINDKDNRKRKVWLLLAHLIYRRGQTVSPSEMAALLWENAEEQANVQGSLKTMLYRARTLLDDLGEGMGHTLILRRGNGYTFNPDVPLETDISSFDALCVRASSAQNDDERLELYQQALTFYAGDFLSTLWMESWVVPISAYYHQKFLEIADQTLQLMEKKSRWEDIRRLCAHALKLEPYSESLYRYRMRSYLAAGNRAAVAAVYKEMSELLSATFGVSPSEETQALYQEAMSTAGEQAQTPLALRDQLLEQGSDKGAMLCEYEFFKLLYRMTARSIARTGDTVHIAVLTIKGARKETPARRRLERISENLRDIAVQNLRQGDVVSQCSVSQLILMLPQADYQNSCMVCGRVLRAFDRKYPHANVVIDFHVQALEPRTTDR